MYNKKIVVLIVSLVLVSVLIFTAFAVIRGDVNSDGIYDTKDVVSLMGKLKNGTATNHTAYDLNNDGTVDKNDATVIQNYYLGLTNTIDDYNAPTGVKVGLVAIDNVNRVNFGTLYNNIGEYTVSTKANKDVGVMFFPWLGSQGDQISDVTEVLRANNWPANQAVTNDINHIAWSGGGSGYASAPYQFWGKPIWGYYYQKDTWVIRRQIEMLIMAGVDFLVVDYTNGYPYDNLLDYTNSGPSITNHGALWVLKHENHSQMLIPLLEVLLEYQNNGWNVPKITFNCHDAVAGVYTGYAGRSMAEYLYYMLYENNTQLWLYNDATGNEYNAGSIKDRYKSLWYYAPGTTKPMMIFNSSGGGTLTTTVKNYFYQKETVWPTEVTTRSTAKTNGFPWIDWHRQQLLYSGGSPSTSVVNVSIAQNGNSKGSAYSLSAMAFYGDKGQTSGSGSNRYPRYSWGRSYHDDGGNSNGVYSQYTTTTTSATWYNGAGKWDFESNPESAKYGLNFQEEWERAILMNPTMINVTSWNEWIAGRSLLPAAIKTNGINMIDDCTQEYSRDAEPMADDFVDGTKNPLSHEDNYYLQIMENIRRYKQVDNNNLITLYKKAVDIYAANTAEQWNDVGFAFGDFDNNTAYHSFRQMDVMSPTNAANLLIKGKIDDVIYEFPRTYHPEYPAGYYQDFSGRNEIVESRVTFDSQNVYFYVKTLKPITAYSSGDNWMNLLIGTDLAYTNRFTSIASTSNTMKFNFLNNPQNSFMGFNFIINRSPNTTDRTTTISKWNGTDYVQQSAGIKYNVTGNIMQVEIPRAVLGFSEADKIKLSFKWADNITEPLRRQSYYTTGDTAPIGSLGYYMEEQ